MHSRNDDGPRSHVLSLSFPGSLFACLKRAGWATSLYAGVANAGQEASTAAWIFTITLNLTQEGYAHYEDVMSTIILLKPADPGFSDI
jgi:secreted Zn-dependent insulinase-like peptidase